MNSVEPKPVSNCLISEPPSPVRTEPIVTARSQYVDEAPRYAQVDGEIRPSAAAGKGACAGRVSRKVVPFPGSLV